MLRAALDLLAEYHRFRADTLIALSAGEEGRDPKQWAFDFAQRVWVKR